METVFQRADQGLSTTAQFIPAGTVQPGMPFNPSTANQCAYGQTYRSSKRGGKYVATVADCPQPSIYVRGHCVLLIDGRFIAHRTDCGCINAVAVWVCRDWVQPCACCVCTAQGSSGGCAGLTRAPSGKSRLNHILCRYLRLLSEVTSGSKIVIRAGFTLFVHRSIGITITISHRQMYGPLIPGIHIADYPYCLQCDVRKVMPSSDYTVRWQRATVLDV